LLLLCFRDENTHKRNLAKKKNAEQSSSLVSLYRRAGGALATSLFISHLRFKEARGRVCAIQRGAAPLREAEEERFYRQNEDVANVFGILEVQFWGSDFAARIFGPPTTSPSCFHHLVCGAIVRVVVVVPFSGSNDSEHSFQLSVSNCYYKYTRSVATNRASPPARSSGAFPTPPRDARH
jgi:hypothetical protein